MPELLVYYESVSAKIAGHAKLNNRACVIILLKHYHRYVKTINIVNKTKFALQEQSVQQKIILKFIPIKFRMSER